MAHRLPVPAAIRHYFEDPLLRNSTLITVTTVMMAGAGGVFWVLAARLASPREVGLAGSMVSTTEVLAVFSLVGFDVALTRALQISRTRGTDVVVGIAWVFGVGLLLASAYVLLLPLTSPTLADVLHHPLPMLVFAVLAAGTAVNLLCDGIFLAIDKVLLNLVCNGIVIGLLKFAMPFVLTGLGAIGVYSAFALSTTIGAATCTVLILRVLGRPYLGRASRELKGARKHARAAYGSALLLLTPQMVLPLIVINQLGAAANARFFVAWQIFTLFAAVIANVGYSLFAEASRTPHQARELVRRAGRTMAVVAVGGAVLLLLAAPLLLLIFGGSYADQSTASLRLLALGALTMALNTHAATALRIAGHRAAMVLVQLVSTVTTIGLALALAPRGIEWVAASVILGNLVGGLLGQVVSRTVAPVVDRPLVAEDQPSAPQGERL